MKASSFTTILVLGGGACAAALSAAAMIMAMMAAALNFATDESTSVRRGASCLLFPGGPGACALPTDTGYGNDHHMIQTGFLGATNMTGGAAIATASYGSHDSPLDGYLCCDLVRGSGGDKIIGIPPFWGALGRVLAQPFSFLGSSIRCDSALHTRGGGGVGAAPSPAPLP